MLSLSRLWLLLACTAVASPVIAQTQPTSPAGRSPFSVTIDPGFSSASSDTGFAIGSTVSFAVNDRLSLEGAMSRLARGGGVHAMHVGAGLRVNLVPSNHRLVPYVAAGGGLYRTSFDMGNNRLFGRMNGAVPAGTRMTSLGTQGGFGMMGDPGTPGSPGHWTGMMGSNGPFGPGQGQYFGTFSSGSMPMFYSQRMGTLTVPADGNWAMRSFNDPAVSLGGGLLVDLTRHLYARPDVRAIVVLADGRSYTVTVASFAFGYRF